MYSRILMLLIVCSASAQGAEHAKLLVNPLYSQALKSIDQRDYTGAELELRQLLALNGTNAEARFQLARVLSWTKRYTEAEGHYRILLQNEPDNTDYLLGLGQTLLWRGWRQEAIRVLNVANRLTPHYVELRRAQIAALAGGDPGERKRAADLLAKARKEFPEADWDRSPTLPNRSTSGGSDNPSSGSDKSRP
ncbi:MAG: tetratricopeptide repeat protein [Methylococcaceae bacterium]|nr:tetratricopeptide repeat protein [Methylococcaceae bacterium]